MSKQLIRDEHLRYAVFFFFISTIFISATSADSGPWSYIGNAYEANGNAVLTQNQNGQVGAIWLNQNIKEPFTANFRYKAGGGSGADGLVFMFYKNGIGNSPPGGVNLGFGGGRGYGIEFDSWTNQNLNEPQGKHVALIKDSASNHLTYSNFNGVNDNQWHDVRIVVGERDIDAYVDGRRMLTWNGELDRTYGGIGFSAATGGANDWHEIGDVTIEYTTTERTVTSGGGKGDAVGKTIVTHPTHTITLHSRRP